MGTFALEYAFSLARARDRKAFLLSGWRILDLLIVLLPLASLLWQESDALRVSPALRLIRVVLFSARLGGVVTRGPAAALAVPEVVPLTVSVLRAGEPPRAASWDEVARGLRSKGQEWFHASGVERTHMDFISLEAGVSSAFLSQILTETAYPRVEVYDRFTALFTWVPSVEWEGENPRVDRRGLLVLAADDGVLTLAQRSMPIQEEVAGSIDELGFAPSAMFSNRAILGILKNVLRRYESVAGQLEHGARSLELVPVRESRPAFLERTFRLQRQISMVKSDLWRLKGVLAAIAEGRLPFHGIDSDGRSVLRVLADEASYAYETAFNTREALLSLIDLHLNVVSFEMNKVMRLLAVVSALGLIPTIVGGLLGMNLRESPWPLTLAQVSFAVSMGMASLLYVFLVKGWLR